MPAACPKTGWSAGSAGVSHPGSLQRPEPGEFFALDHERDHYQGIPSIAAVSAGAPFIFSSAMMALQFFVVLFIYPETKGITLEQMQRRLGID